MRMGTEVQLTACPSVQRTRGKYTGKAAWPWSPGQSMAAWQKCAVMLLTGLMELLQGQFTVQGAVQLPPGDVDTFEGISICLVCWA